MRPCRLCRKGSQGPLTLAHLSSEGRGGVLDVEHFQIELVKLNKSQRTFQKASEGLSNRDLCWSWFTFKCLDIAREPMFKLIQKSDAKNEIDKNLE